MQVFQDPQGFWSSVGFTYKFLLVANLVIFFLCLLFSSIILVDIPTLIISQLQIWRLFFPYLAQIPTLFSLISVAFSFLWMAKFFDVLAL